MRTIKWLATSALCMGLLFTACKKDSDTIETEQMVASEDQTTVADLYEDTDDQVEDAIETRGGGGTCPIVTVTPDDGTFPRSITIDYGTDGCTGPGGRLRKGQILVTESAERLTTGAVRTVTFVGFSIDDAQIEGTRTLTNTGSDASNNVTFTRTVSGGKITFPSGKTVTWDASHTLTQVEGGSTAAFSDNVFEITGGSSGVNRNGKAFSMTITEPLLKKRNCFWLVSGAKTLTVEDKTVSIDYGDGDCDRKAVVTLPNGSTREITIRRWW